MIYVKSAHLLQISQGNFTCFLAGLLCVKPLTGQMMGLQWGQKVTENRVGKKTTTNRISCCCDPLTGLFNSSCVWLPVGVEH